MAEAEASLAGQVRLRVAAGLPAIRSSRAEWAARLAPGRPVDTWPRLVGTLFALCAPAHRLCAERALSAAQGAPGTASPAQREQLRLATLRDQVHRIAHDWPRQLTPAQHDATATLARLRHSPLWQPGLTPGDALAALPTWLSQQWLGGESLPLARDRLADDAGHGAARWARAQAQRSALAQWLSTWHETLTLSPLGLAVPDLPLRLQDDDLPQLARSMATAPGFCLQPHWHGTPRSTGPWSRHADTALPCATTAWHLLVARLLDTLHLALPGGEHRLWHGALTLGPGEGLAWCEMARGLLVHRVVLAPDGRHLAAAQVLAPTEWNFHPEGPLAQALAGLDPRWPTATLDAAARCLAVAFDPCVDFSVEPPDTRCCDDKEARCHA